MGYYYDNYLGWGFGGIVMMLAMVAFWIGIIWLIIYAVRGGDRKNDVSGSKSPMDILKERYAKGEINKEEFESKKKDLGY